MAQRHTWVRVKDRQTRHEFDVLEGDKRIGVLFDLVKRSDPSPVARPAKHHKKLAVLNVPRQTPDPSGDGKPDTKES